MRLIWRSVVKINIAVVKKTNSFFYAVSPKIRLVYSIVKKFFLFATKYLPIYTFISYYFNYGYFAVYHFV